MDAQSVGTGISIGIFAVVFLIVSIGFFRQTILWTVEDKIRAERDETRRQLEALRAEIRSSR